jgi:hypothetical protein
MALQAVKPPISSTEGKFLFLNPEDNHLGNAFTGLGFVSRCQVTQGIHLIVKLLPPQ